MPAGRSFVLALVEIAALGALALAACGDDAAQTASPDGGSVSSADAAREAPPDGASTSPGDARTALDGTSDGGGALENPAPASELFVGANFWNIDWEGHEDYFVAGVDFATTTNPWRADFVSALAPYAVLRFMDWDLTNTSDNPQANWSRRKKKTDPQGEAVAYDWQIDLCNRARKDCWFNVPHEADPAYWANLATLVHDQLDPHLRAYIEWSNEVWNGGFPQNAYAASHAADLSLPGSDDAASYYVYQSVRLYEAFEAVFGKGNPRLVKVLAGQAAYTGPCEAHMTALADTMINPNRTIPDVYAIAPYFSGNTARELSGSVPTMGDWTRSHVTCAAKRGLPVISYEGGQDSYAAGAGCVTLQHDPAMHDIYISFLDTIADAGLKGPFMQYTHSGRCWGLQEKTGEPASSSPKYKGVTDWLAAH